jgi:hypothetical protein
MIVKMLIVATMCLLMSGCLYYGRWQESLANADLLEERAAIAKLYRKCLEKYQDDPEKSKAQCEHFTQSLQALDVRGVK